VLVIATIVWVIIGDARVVVISPASVAPNVDRTTYLATLGVCPKTNLPKSRILGLTRDVRAGAPDVILAHFDIAFIAPSG
jgi:hypothetical protein